MWDREKGGIVGCRERDTERVKRTRLLQFREGKRLREIREVVGFKSPSCL